MNRDGAPLVVERLVAGYGEEPVLDDVSLTTNAGEILVVFGGSGSGKSTLLRCAVGLLAPRAGRVLIEGRDLFAASPEERQEILRGVGLAFQSAALLSSMTAAENVAFPIVESGIEEPTALMLARIRLARVGLADVADRMPTELPIDVRKRVGIARAMALDPPLLLLDEPTTGLDPTASRALDEVILGVKRHAGTAVVVVSHDVASIETIGDRGVMLAGGKVIASGALDEVRRNPDPRVRAFFERRAAPAADHSSVLDEVKWPG